MPDKRKDEEAEAEGEQIKDNHAGEGVMDVGSGLLDVGDAEKVEMEGGEGESNRAKPSHDDKKAQDGEMTEVGDAGWRGNLELIPGLEEGAFGDGLAVLGLDEPLDSIRKIVNHRRQNLIRREGVISAGGRGFRDRGVLFRRGGHASPVFFLRGPEVFAAVLS